MSNNSCLRFSPATSVSADSPLSCKTQAELIRSTIVLSAAAEAPELRSLATFEGIDNPVGLIRKYLTVDVGNDDIINVSIELPNAEDASQIVNAVVDAYIAKYAEKRSTNVADVLGILRDEKRLRDNELESRRKALEEFRKSHVALAVQTAGENTWSPSSLVHFPPS